MLGRASTSTIYTPLDHSRPQTHLLELLPGNKEDPIRYRLHMPRLLYKAEYEALYYAYCNLMDALKKISVDDTVVHITPNLEAALYCI